jgi:hypothetical protein
MVSAWPVDLPQAFQISGFSEGSGDGSVEYQPDVGPPLTRLRTAAVVRPMAGNMILTDVQLASFRTFFDTTLLSGTLPFNFPDQVRSGTLLVKFTKQNRPSWLNLGGPTYQLNLTFVVLP